MVIELNSGITCGVGVVLFGRHFQNSTALVVTRILILLMSCLPNQRFHRDLQFYKEPQDWEMEQFDIFWNLTHSMTFTGEGHDKLCWKSTKNKGFKVSEFYPSSRPLTIFFLGNLCGTQRSLLKLLSFLGLPPWARF